MGLFENSFFECGFFEELGEPRFVGGPGVVLRAYFEFFEEFSGFLRGGCVFGEAVELMGTCDRAEGGLSELVWALEERGGEECFWEGFGGPCADGKVKRAWALWGGFYEHCVGELFSEVEEDTCLVVFGFLVSWAVLGEDSGCVEGEVEGLVARGVFEQ